MTELTPKERRALRARAHHLHPVVIVGHHGLTPQVLNEIDVALTAHGLIKVRVNADDRDVREAMLARIADELHAAPVQHLGKLLVVWRARDEDDEERAEHAAPRPEPPAQRRRPPAGPASGAATDKSAGSRRRRRTTGAKRPVERHEEGARSRAGARESAPYAAARRAPGGAGVKARAPRSPGVTAKPVPKAARKPAPATGPAGRKATTMSTRSGTVSTSRRRRGR